MKTEALRNISTDDLRSRIKDTTLELDRLKGELRRRVGEFNTILNSGHATPRRRQLTLTPTHREISSTVQEKVGGARQTASAKAEELTGKAKEASPDSATEGAQRAAGMVRENPLPVAAGASFVVGVIFGRLLGRRKYRQTARGKG